MTSAATQPILCCLGLSVAGKPTQYLMERAFEDAGLDWKAITAEVEPDLLPIALQGLAAMRFTALRLFPSIEQSSAGVLCGEKFSGSDACRFIGAVTSAQCTQGGWRIWHNSGWGLMNLLKQRSLPDDSLLWLHGDSMLTRSCFAAWIESNAAYRVVWSSGPSRGGVDEALPEEFPGDESLRPAVVKAVAEQRLTWIDAAEDLFRLVGELESGDNDQVETHATDQPEDEPSADVAEPGAAPKLSWTGERVVVAVGDELSELLSSSQRFPVSRRIVACSSDATVPTAPEIEILSRADQAVASEAYDFQRWTGLAPNVALMKDAYEEYCDF